MAGLVVIFTALRGSARPCEALNSCSGPGTKIFFTGDQKKDYVPGNRADSSKPERFKPLTLAVKTFLIDMSIRRDDSADISSYPFTIPAVAKFKRLIFNPAVTILTGENGMGKSTLLEGIAVYLGFNPEGGSRSFNFSSRESHSSLHNFIKIARTGRRPHDNYFLRAESFFNVATEIDNLDVAGSYGGVSLHEQSHGESFMTLLTKRFRGNGLYILDEPEAALSPMRQLAALARIHELVKSGSQFILSTHSPILMSYPGATMYLLDDNGISETEYEDTLHYQVSKRFFGDYKSIIKELLRGTETSEG